MRWLAGLALAVAAGCSGSDAPATLGLVLDIPNGPLDPAGFTSVDVVIHEPGMADVELQAPLVGGGFALGKISPSPAASIEATLRSDSGAAVGYGRTGVAAALTGGEEIVVPVRRPIAYIAGLASQLIAMNTSSYEQRPATFSDLSVTTALDGTTTLDGEAVLIVAAGGDLYQVSQSADAAGKLIGDARLAPISTANHAVGTALTGAMAGEVLDGAGADDGSALAIATTTQLYAVAPSTGTATPLAAGRFSQVAVVSDDSGAQIAVAIKRAAAEAVTCGGDELWWARLDGSDAHKVATGGFGDVASERGHAYYVDACTGELGEVTSAAASKLRMLTGRPTALAVANDQAYVGLEAPPDGLSLVIAAMHASDAPRVLWTEQEQQVVRLLDFATVQRQLPATAAAITHLEIGAGGDFVALSTRSRFEGPAIRNLLFPRMNITTEELRVFDAASGGNVQRYRSACDGSITIAVGDEFDNWDCATSPGQLAAALDHDHAIRSMTFQFGKK